MFEKRNSRDLLGGWTSIIFAGTVFALVCAPFGTLSAYTLHRPHSFCAENNCDDGEDPGGSLVSDASGNLYGTTLSGGLYGHGVVFELVPNLARTKWAYHRLHSFCKNTGCPDGDDPIANLIMDVDGNLYGTTWGGGKYDNGLIFELVNANGIWSEKILHQFRYSSGAGPLYGLSYYGQSSGAPWDKVSPLFGVADSGGRYGNGMVYILNHDGDTWNVSVIHAFSAGRFPGALVVDSASNLYGTTEEGNKYNGGALYELLAGSWKEKTLHNFCSQPNCADGNDPGDGLVMDSANNIYGVTYLGGSNCPSNQIPGCGVAFERTAGGSYQVLYNFCSDTTACHDGRGPRILTLDQLGRIFGTASYGGTSGNDGGVVFQLFPGTPWTKSVLYSFCSQGPPNCTDGSYPDDSLLEDETGDLFGLAIVGGAHGSGGEVFELEP